MAAESDGVPDMVSGDDQPIDLSRTPRKPLRVMPPLIPIKLLRAGYAAQQAGKQVKANEITLASLIKGKSEIKAVKNVRSKCSEDNPNPAKPVVVASDETDADDEKDGDRDGDEGDEDDEDEEEEDEREVLRKRVRLANGAEAEAGARARGGSGGADRWQRLDRARSVPQLTPLPLPLLRSKSLSESRIPAAAAGAAAGAARAARDSGRMQRGDSDVDVARPSAPSTPLLRTQLMHSPPPEELRLQLQAAAALRRAAEGVSGEGGAHPPAAAGSPFNNSWIYVGYYSQLLHRFQAQEFLRQLALQHQQDAQAAQKTDPAPTSKTAIPIQEEESVDVRRRQARPLTGKHVRPGTGASPATLLTLRRKIQARQQQHDLKRVLE